MVATMIFDISFITSELQSKQRNRLFSSNYEMFTDHNVWWYYPHIIEA